MNAALLALLIAAADVPPAEPHVSIVKVAVVRDPDSVGEREVVGGCHISGTDCLARAREKAECCARADRLAKGVVAPPWLLVGTAVVAFAAGVAVAVVAINSKGKP